MNEMYFCHANGFPSKVYLPMLDSICCANINYIPIFGTSELGIGLGIDSLADELISEIERKSSSPVVGVGHSMGGTIVFLAATKRPDLFLDVILLEPVLWGAGRMLILQAFKSIGLGNLGNPAVRTLKRRNQFNDITEARNYFSGKRIFKSMDSRCFEEYLKHGLVPHENGLKLAIPPGLESSLFNCQLLRFPKESYVTKGTIVHAKKSNTLLLTDKRWMKKTLHGFDFKEVDGGHMFPVENPEGTASLINRILKNRLHI